MRLRSDIWVAAYRRHAVAGGAYVVVRRKGVEQAGAIFIHVDRLDGYGALYGPAPQSDASLSGERRFVRLHDEETLEAAAIERRLSKELRFDPDLWIVVVEDRQGRPFLDGMGG